MIARREKFSGNILLYDYLAAKRGPIFLRRNLTRAWEVHRHLSQNGNLQRFTGDNHQSRNAWELPTRDELDEIMDHCNSHGSFTLEVHGFGAVVGSESHRGRNPSRKARVEWRAEGQIKVSVYHSGSNTPCFQTPEQGVVLRQVKFDDDRTLTVDTDAITIKPAKFEPPGIQPNAEYSFRVGITLDSQDEAANVFRHFATPGQTINPDDCPTRLMALHSTMLVCPSGRTILPFRDYKTTLGFGLEISMHWKNVTRGSILAVHNAKLRSMTQPTSYPSPPPDVGSKHKTYKLIFVYANETIERTTLQCPHEGCRQRKVKDIDDLRMHLDSWHDYFKYHARLEQRDGSGNEIWVFECEVSDHRSEQRASARADEPFDVHNVAPRQAFNQAKYLNDGNDDFQRMTRLEKRQPTHRTVAPLSVPIPPRPKPPDLVVPMPPRLPRKYPVPEAPRNVAFIRSKSRRILRTGEMISESDDDSEHGDWTKVRKDAEIDGDETLPDEVKRFLRGYDTHVWDEYLETDFHLGDTIVRFVRDRGAWIWEEDVLDAFKQKIDELLEDELISKITYDACLQIVQNQKPSVTPETATELSAQLARLDVDAPRGRSKGKAKVTEMGNLTPITADSDGDLEMRESVLNKEPNVAHDEPTGAPPYDLCICGLDAQGARGAQIDCNNMV